MRAGSRLLRDVEVAAYLSARMEQVLAARHMSSDEALARLEMMARLNVQDFIDEKGRPLEPQKWPAEIASCVRAFHYGQDGVKLTFVDPHTALRTIYEVTGKLKSATAESIDHLAEALRADLERSRK